MKCDLLEARFVDILGRVKAMAIPLTRPSDDLHMIAQDPAVAKGVSADGSSVQGYMQIQDSDLHLAPDPTTVFRLPYDPRRAAAYCDVYPKGARGRLTPIEPLWDPVGGGSSRAVRPVD